MQSMGLFVCKNKDCKGHKYYWIKWYFVKPNSNFAIKVYSKTYVTNNGNVSVTYYRQANVVAMGFLIDTSSSWATGSEGRISFNLDEDVPASGIVTFGIGLNMSTLMISGRTVRIQNNLSSAIAAGNRQEVSVCYITR